MHRLLRVVVLLLTCTSCSTTPAGPGGLPVRPGVTVVHDFGPVSVACRTESACPQYQVPLILDVVHRGRDWLVLYLVESITDPVFGDTTATAGYFVSRDDGETWSVPELTGASYGPRLATTLGATFAYPTSLFVASGEIYQVVPFEMELGTGTWTFLQVWRIDLDGARLERMGTVNWAWGYPDGDVFATYDFHAENHASPTYFTRFDPTMGTFAEELGGEYTDLAMHHVGLPPVWRELYRDGRDVVLGGFATDQYLPSYPLRRCFLRASPPSQLQPGSSCVDDAEWPVPEEARSTVTTIPFGRSRAAVAWTEGTGTAERTRALTISGPSEDGTLTTVEVGPGRMLLPQTDAIVQSRGNGGIDHPRFAGLMALTEEIADGSRRTVLHRLNAVGAFVPTRLPTRPCPDDASCGYRPESVRGGRYDSSLQWVTSLSGDDYRMFWVVDVATESQSQIVVLTSLERLDRGPPSPAGALEEACALEQACLGASGAPIDRCTLAWLHPTEATPAALERFTSARTCDEIRAADPGAFAFGGACSSSPLECIDDVAYSCDGGSRLGAVVDCGRLGATCSVLADGTAQCAPAGIDCATQAGTCDSGRAILCGMRGAPDCAASGLTCETATGFPSCALRTAACTAPATNVCDGARVVDCQQPGLGLVAKDCARLGLGCEDGGGVGECGDGSGACDATYQPRCDGSRLVYCLGTTLRAVDCAHVGAVCAADGGDARCAMTMGAPDAGTPDAGAPTTSCGSGALAGAPLAETERADYPTPGGGTIADGTYVLTSYELWSASAQSYTHRETMVVAGSVLSITSEHSALGASSSSGAFSVTGSDLTYTPDCASPPGPPMYQWRFSVTGSGLIVLDGSVIRTYERR